MDILTLLIVLNIVALAGAVFMAYQCYCADREFPSMLDLEVAPKESAEFNAKRSK